MYNEWKNNQGYLDNDEEKPSRAKRSISRDHTVELMIVADNKMVKYHGEALEPYILSLIAVVGLSVIDSWVNWVLQQLSFSPLIVHWVGIIIITAMHATAIWKC